MPFRGAIFDLDGVIVDTVPLHFQAWQKMFAEYGRKFNFQDYKTKVDGIPRLEGAKAILTDLSNEELEQAATRKQNYFLKFLAKEGVEAYKSTLNLIKELKQNNIQVAVISSSKNCLSILKQAKIDNLFATIITGNDVQKGKPDPQIFILAAQRLGLKPQDCLVFEDALLGVEAAKRGNFKCIGVDRYGQPARLARADLVVSDLSQLNWEKLKKI